MLQILYILTKCLKVCNGKRKVAFKVNQNLLLHTFRHISKCILSNNDFFKLLQLKYLRQNLVNIQLQILHLIIVPLLNSISHHSLLGLRLKQMSKVFTLS